MFMAIVSSFLIVGLLVLIFSLLLVFTSGTEGLGRKMTEMFLVAYVYILLNYMIYFFSKNAVVAVVSLLVTSIPFTTKISNIFFRRVIGKKLINREESGKWKCRGCGSLNEHSLNCWHCNAEKILA